MYPLGERNRMPVQAGRESASSHHAVDVARRGQQAKPRLPEHEHEPEPESGSLSLDGHRHGRFA